MDKHIIYEFVSPNGKRYIGRTTNFNNRITHHRYRYNNQLEDWKLYKALRKYGWDNFSINVICEVDTLEDAIDKEKEYIQRYDTVNVGYNHTDNTMDGGTWKYSVSQERWDEYRKKMSNKMKGKNNPMYGKSHSNDAIKKQKQKAKGRFSLEWYIDRNGKVEGTRLYEERRVWLKNRNLPKDENGKFIKKKS